MVISPLIALVFTTSGRAAREAPLGDNSPGLGPLTPIKPGRRAKAGQAC
jgi:hypothetical protein